MNLPTDVATRKELNLLSRQESSRLIHAISKTDSPRGRPSHIIDKMFIKVGNIPFTYSTTNISTGTTRRTKLNINGMAQIHQGEVVFFMGPRGGGKGSLLKIIG